MTTQTYPKFGQLHALPGAGPLGEAGLDGYIDTHFSERFGAAILVSLIGDLRNWVGNREGSQNNNSLRLDGTSSAAQDAVTTVLENTINIPPTLYRNQGGRVGIYVARDLDFSGVQAAGGVEMKRDAPQNSMPACPPCNIDKQAMSLEAWRGRFLRTCKVLAGNYPIASAGGVRQNTPAL